MTAIFNYSSLKVFLEKETRTLKILLNRPEFAHAINSEMVFELESVLAWASSRLEINSILISSTKVSEGDDMFCCGIDNNELNHGNQDKIERLLKRIQKIIFACFHLPQTIILDYKQGASGIGAELGIGADMRIASDSTNIQFNHLKNGRTPQCGGISILGTVVPYSTAKNWLLSGSTVSIDSLKSSGFIHSTYNQNTQIDFTTKLLLNIQMQAPVQRIQCKNAFTLMALNELEKNIIIEEKTSKAAMATADWQEAISANLQNRRPEYLNAKSFASITKQALSKIDQ